MRAGSANQRANIPHGARAAASPASVRGAVRGFLARRVDPVSVRTRGQSAVHDDAVRAG